MGTGRTYPESRGAEAVSRAKRGAQASTAGREGVIAALSSAAESIEALVIAQMKALAEQAGASWEVVLRADSTDHGSRDWRNLVTLVRRAIPAVEQRLLESEKTVLVTYAGLLARYDQLDMLDRLRDATERQEGTPGFLVLLPADQQTNMPVIDGTPLPVVLASQWARLTDAWIANEHRGASRTGGNADKRVETS